MRSEVGEWFLRVTLAAGFLSAVADRLGLWGAAGDPGVAWGGWAPFVQYTAHLNWFLPAALIPLVSWLATILEVIIAFGLLANWHLRHFAAGAGVLLIFFGITMTIADGVKGPLDSSVFTAAAGALYLAALRTNEQAARVFSRRFSN